MENKPNLVPDSHFTTVGIETSDRFEAWEDSISVLFDVAPIELKQIPIFGGDVKSFMLDTMMLSKCSSNIQFFERSLQTIARDGMDHIMIQYYLEGGNCIYTKNSEKTTKPGDIQILDMTQPVKTQTYNQMNRSSSLEVDKFTNISLFIARDKLDELLPCVEMLHQHIIPAGTPINTILRTYINSLYDNASCMTNDEAEALVKPTAELIASSVNSLGLFNEPDRQLDMAAIIAVKKFIRDNLANPQLTPDFIAHKLGMSRSSLFRLCKPLGGVLNFIRSRRLLIARDMLRHSSGSGYVKNICYSTGFTNPTSFARAYKQRFGYSPTETREMFSATAERSSINSGTTTHNTAVDRRYEYWMNHLVL